MSCFGLSSPFPVADFLRFLIAYNVCQSNVSNIQEQGLAFRFVTVVERASLKVGGVQDDGSGFREKESPLL